jgi:uncharacterized protein YjiS (DUF1127 family)
MLSQNSKRATPAADPSKLNPCLLREDHIVLFVMDGVLAAHAAIGRWFDRRRTRQVLAALDDHQLRDIGVTRADVPSASGQLGAVLARRADGTRVGGTLPKARRWWSLGRDVNRRALAELDDSQLSNLSDAGLQVRREARRAGASS